VRIRRIGWLLCLWLGVALAPQGARAEMVALTFDDLPTLALTEAPDYARGTTVRLVRGLVRHRMPATGFVVGAKLADCPRERAALLRAWTRAGLELGNHTYSHASLNTTPLPAYLADMARDDDLLRRLRGPGGGRPRWFRHPYLETGATLADKAGVEAWLAAQGYKVAPVTLENSDDVFALPYDEAVLAGETRRAREIRDAYLAFTDKSVVWYREAARELLGRRPALVFLLHATRLNADSVDGLAAILRRHDLRPASLAAVLRDPAYALPEGPVDKDGDDWLNRWAAALNRDLPWDSFPEPPSDIAAATARLDEHP
jgi:peptidoglycan/xylan/chitin deacetylase (PgdA/CDA1 family)